MLCYIWLYSTIQHHFGTKALTRNNSDFWYKNWYFWYQLFGLYLVEYTYQTSIVAVIIRNIWVNYVYLNHMIVDDIWKVLVQHNACLITFFIQPTSVYFKVQVQDIYFLIIRYQSLLYLHIYICYLHYLTTYFPERCANFNWMFH